MSDTTREPPESPPKRRAAPTSGWVLVVLAGALLYWVVDSSPSFKNCIHDHKNDAAYHQLHEDGAIASRVARLHLQTVCVEDWTEHYQGAIGAVATLMVAAFTFTLWRATKRLWQSAEDQLREFRRSLSTAEQHASHMAASVTEAGRAATAMQNVATAMQIVAESAAQNTEVVKAMSTTNREIADRQKLVSELQSRAYLSIQFQVMVPQNTETGVRFEPRMLLVNDGVMTSAYKVTYQVAADVLPHPLSADFGFPLPEIQPTRSVSTIGPRQHRILGAVVPRLYSDAEAEQIKIGIGQRIHIWGRVEYEDAFGIERYVRFCKSFAWIGPEAIMAYDTARHNDSD